MTVVITSRPVFLELDEPPVCPSSEPASGSIPQLLFTRYPTRVRVAHWPATGYKRSEVERLVALVPCAETSTEDNRRRGLRLLLGWLEEQPGDSWQERWLASGADAAGDLWAQLPALWLECQGISSVSQLTLMTSSFLVLVGIDVVRPSISWLLTGGKKRKLTQHMTAARDAEGFERLRLACQQDRGVTYEAEKNTMFRTAVIIAAKGGKIGDVTIGDVLEVMAAETVIRGTIRSGSASFRVLREMGIFGSGVPTLREIRSIGQRPVEQLVDRYPIANRPIRDLIVDYLRERQCAIDYGTLRNLAYVLAKCFWLEIEAQQPGIATLNLPPEVAGAWKRRLQSRTLRTRTDDGKITEARTERLSFLDTLATVRAFYLDLAQWALQDPGRWGPWVAVCPIRQDELARRKAVRRRKARMDARTRERLPVLPELARSVHRWHKDADALLAAGRDAVPGQEFTAGSTTLVRCVKPHAAEDSVWAAETAAHKPRFLNREEDHAFWAWAVIEVLRLTGVRAEELLELSHQSLVQYRLPTTGELVPLLQIAPSKTDEERLLVVSPELADVLSEIICRIRDSTGSVPLVRARDRHEHVWLPPSPLLFQRRLGAENHSFSVNLVSTLLDEALGHSGLVDQADGAPLHYTAHDFRRLFITDAILNGLPPHIAQVIAGHRDINVTMGYKAAYPEETIQAHLAFLSRRRSLRPSEEYRVPTDEEWQAFLGHFERRKVSVGTCGRSFGTPCIHEHACVRCPMLWPEPAQQSRLAEIRDNLTARIAEAEREGWLGEVEGLQISLAGAIDKLVQIERRRPDTVELAMPRRIGSESKRANKSF